MTWFKVDDSFHSHPKVLATEPAALGLWVVAGAWSSSNLTDGFVPDYVLTRLLPDALKLAEKLKTSGLWHRKKGGYQFHDWGDYNPSKDEVEAERQAARSRMKTLRANRRTAGQSGNRSPEQQANVRENFGVRSQPRPVPTRPDKDQDPPVVPPASKADGRRGTRLPEDFEVTDAMKGWARDNTPLANRTDHEAFLDYWRSATGQRAVKRDWEATWRNWMRKVQTDRDRRPAGSRPTTDDKVSGFIERGRRLQALQDQTEHDPKELTA